MQVKISACLFFLIIFVQVLPGQNTSYVKPNIYAVVVGVSDYKDPSIPDLKFAEKDAIAFNDFLRSSIAGSIPEENISLLTGESATRGGIYKAIVDLFSRSTKEDMVIFYFSGHGKAGFNEHGYLLAYDSDMENDPGTGLSMPELNNTIENFKAKMQVSYVDACHAGLFASQGKGLLEDGNAVIAKTFLDILSKADRASVRFLASSARQQSQEDEVSGHGVFTHYLLKGLRGEADLSQPGMPSYNDGLVSISELNTYLTAGIPKHTKYKQIPSVAGEYNDEFPLSVLKADVTLSTVISKVEGNAPKPSGVGLPGGANNNVEAACTNCKGVGTVTAQGICNNCTGSGSASCRDCSGSGKQSCKNCRGSGQVDIAPTRGIYSPTCTVCNGAGSLKCRTCAGKGSGTCSQCKGQSIAVRNEVCTRCNGSGKTIPGGKSFLKLPAGKTTCTTCNGEGLVKSNKACETCDGTGRLTCKNCRGTGSFEGMFRSDPKTICTACSGKGASSCGGCSGKGKLVSLKSCTNCNGTGELKP